MLSKSLLAACSVCILALYVQPGLGLTVTTPSEGYLWNPSEPLHVHWTSVSTDPATLNIQISNQNSNTYPTGFSQNLTNAVKSSDGHYTITGLGSLTAGPGYRVDLVSDTGGILAQSQPFNITSSSSSTNSNVTSSASPDSNMTATVSSQHPTDGVTPHTASGSIITATNTTGSATNVSSSTSSAWSVRIGTQGCIGIGMAFIFGLILV